MILKEVNQKMNIKLEFFLKIVILYQILQNVREIIHQDHCD